MSAIYLKGRFKVVEIKKRTKAKLFEELKVGDILFIQKKLCSEKPRWDRTMASYCNCSIEGNPLVVKKSFTELTPILNCFELEEVL